MTPEEEIKLYHTALNDLLALFYRDVKAASLSTRKAFRALALHPELGITIAFIADMVTGGYLPPEWLQDDE